MARIELPLLLHTRTILRHPTRWKAIIRTPLRCSSSETDVFKPTSTSFFKQKAEAQKSAVERTSPTSVAGRTSTTTRAEQKTFDKIWRDIVENKDPSKKGEDVLPKSYADTDPQRILARFLGNVTTQEAEHEGDQDSLETTWKLDQDAATTVTSNTRMDLGRTSEISTKPMTAVTFTPKDSLDRAEVRNSSRAPNPFVMRPSFLTEVHHAETRPAAELHQVVAPALVKVGHPIDHVAGPAIPEPADGYGDAVETTAQREMQRIDTAFRQALDPKQATSADVGLWEVCGRHIFPLMELLEEATSKDGVQGTETLHNRNQSTNLPIRVQKMMREKQLLVNLPTPPPYISPLSVISRIYPAALVLAVRLFATHSPASLYALALLPRVRALGPKSYVLGGTTPIYNALIKLYWDVYSDFQAIDRLLYEMEKGGIEWDQETYDILGEVGEERWRDRQTEEARSSSTGSRGKEWWERPAQVTWFQKVGVDWRRTIAETLRQQGLGESISERDYESQVLRSRGPSSPGVASGTPVVLL